MEEPMYQRVFVENWGVEEEEVLLLAVFRFCCWRIWVARCLRAARSAARSALVMVRMGVVVVVGSGGFVLGKSCEVVVVVGRRVERGRIREARASIVLLLLGFVRWRR